MIPLVDIHCHLLASLDDGPRTEDDAVEMVRMAHQEGVRLMAATAHQNDDWPDVTPKAIRDASAALAKRLSQEGLGTRTVPNAEVMVHPGIEDSWRNGRLLSVADQNKYMLMELPHGCFLDLRATITNLRQCGIRPILAHPERQPEFLHDPGVIEELIRLGCLVQVSAGSITNPADRREEKALRGWAKRGIVHLLGSDGHSPRRRPPRLVDAYRQLRRWAGSDVADRIAGTNGFAVLHGLPLQVVKPRPRAVTWFALW